jgi:hypothetical protein
MFKAWKKLICDGSKPVGPAGTAKSTGETTPTLASVGILLASILVFKVKTGASQKIRAILSLSNGSITLSYGIFPPCSFSRCLNSSCSIPSVLILMIFLTKVFFEITRVPLNALSVFLIC